MSSPNSSVLFEGWLQKRGSDLLGAFGLNWGKRYFKMNSIHLLYYSDFPTSESTLKGSISLADIKNLTRNGKYFTLEMKSSSRTYDLWGDSESNVEDWCFKIRQRLKPISNSPFSDLISNTSSNSNSKNSTPSLSPKVEQSSKGTSANAVAKNNSSGLQSLFNEILSKHKHEQDQDVEEDERVLRGAAFLAISERLKLNELDLLVMMYKLEVKQNQVWELNESDFLKFESKFGCRNADEVYSKVSQFTNSLKNDSKEQRKFYDWTFNYLKQESNKAVLPLAEAVSAWQQLSVILKHWKFFEKFLEFLQNKTPQKEAITLDEWKMTFSFFEKMKQTKSTQEIVKNYSEDDCFPLLFDDFISFLKESK